MILCNFFWFTRFTQLKWLFRNVYLKRFPTRSLSRIFPVFYLVANISKLYSQEHLLIAVSDKYICDKQFDLPVFPRNLLKFGFNIVIGILQCLYSKCCSNTYFWQELLIYGNQSISLRIDVVVVYNENYSTGLRIRLSFFSCCCCFVFFFVFCLFLRIISESDGELCLMYFGIDNRDTRITSLTLF